MLNRKGESFSRSIFSACITALLMISPLAACTGHAPIVQAPDPTAISLTTDTPSPRAPLRSATSSPAAQTSTYDLDVMVTRGVATYSAQQTQWALTPTFTATVTKTATITQTPWTITYSVKQVLLRYATGIGDHSVFDGLFSSVIYYDPEITIYTDGQLIMYVGGYFWQKQLSSSEVNEILANLKQLGFFDIKDRGKSDQPNPIYSGPGDYTECCDGLYTQIMIFGDHPKSISFFEPYAQYVIQPVKAVVNYLNGYKPSSLTRYQPDRLMVYIEKRLRDSPDLVMPVPWPDGITSISERNPYGFLYLEGKSASTLYQLAAGESNIIFTWEGSEYTVFLLPFLPDECVKRVHDPELISRGSPFDFVCED